MKPLRVLLLLVLAVLLPLRSTVAAAMACPAGMAAAAVVGAAAGGHAGHHGPQAVHAGDGPQAHHAEHGAQALHADHGAPVHAEHTTTQLTAPDAGAACDHAAGDEHTGTCQFCASGCCVTPLVSAPPALALVPHVNGAVFPLLRAPVPAFQCEGQERPPRSR
ncbi:MAG: hypothetical protein HY855_05520 [Burkholderiales bacterium]|nr:hypothetical protein [Burkholderiales bacterium]